MLQAPVQQAEGRHGRQDELSVDRQRAALRRDPGVKPVQHFIHVIINTSSTSTYLHVQEFLRTCLEVDMVQGFTMTEATCCGTLQPVGCKQVQI